MIIAETLAPAFVLRRSRRGRRRLASVRASPELRCRRALSTARGPVAVRYCATQQRRTCAVAAKYRKSEGESLSIGIAVDTENGLLVPVIKNADKKNLIEISVELNQLAAKARDKKLSLDEMQGGCFTITNLGGIGGTYFTPIINSPEVAILGVSRGNYEPVFDKNGKFEPRLMLPLSLSYDHRIIDGADAIRFLRWVCEALEEPLKIFM